MTPAAAQQRHKAVGALIFWFGTIGGAMAWILHLAMVWGITETTCLAGGSTIGDVSLRMVLTIGVAIPGLVALASLAVSWRIWRRTDPHRSDDGGRRRQRAHFVAGIGLLSNLLFIAIIAFDGVALLVFPPCLT